MPRSKAYGSAQYASTVAHICFVCAQYIQDDWLRYFTGLDIYVHRDSACSSEVEKRQVDFSKSAHGRRRSVREVLSDLYELRCKNTR